MLTMHATPCAVDTCRTARDMVAAVVTGETVECTAALDELRERGTIGRFVTAEPRTTCGADVLRQLELWGFTVVRRSPTELFQEVETRVQQACANQRPAHVPLPSEREPALESMDPYPTPREDDDGKDESGEASSGVTTLLSNLDVLVVDEMQGELQELLRLTELPSLTRVRPGHVMLGKYPGVVLTGT